MNSIQSFISPSVTQMDKNTNTQPSMELSESSWIESDDINLKLQYLVDSSKTNFEDYDSAFDNEDFGSSPSSLHSYESLLGDDESMATPSFSIDNGLPSPDLVSQTNLNKQLHIKTEHSHQLHSPQPHPPHLIGLPNGSNPTQPRNSNPFMITPIDTPANYEWNQKLDSKMSQSELDRYRRVMQQTQDFSVADVNQSGQFKADQLFSSYGGQFISNDIYPQTITTEIPTTTALYSTQSTITQPLSADSLPNDTPATSIPPLTATYSSLSTPQLSTPMSAKRKNASRKKRTTKPNKNNYDENSKPIAQQLKDNKIIWEAMITKKKKGIYKCTHCPEIFKDLIDLARHMDSNKIARVHKCPFDNCPWSIIGLPRRAEVRRHCAAQHAYVITFENEKTKKPQEQRDSTPIEGDISHVAEKYFCDFDGCDKAFKRKDALQRHEKLVHLNPDSRFNKRMEKEQKKLNKNKSNDTSKAIDNRSFLKDNFDFDELVFD